MNNKIVLSNFDLGAPEYWSYKGEGACNVVVSYTGPHNPNFNGKVLRFKKYDKKKIFSPPIASSNSDIISEETTVSDQKEIELYKYVVDVVSPLIGSEYVYPGEMIRVDKSFIQKLDQHIFNDRPVFRSTLRLDYSQSIGFLISDLTMFNEISLPSSFSHSSVLCIEIKPKWGFLPKSHPYLNKEYSCLKTCYCRYCMHQYTKLSQNQISTISNYCPIDLFSNDVNRQMYSIVELLCNPQNNIKIYCDGELEFTGSQGGGVERDRESSISTISNLLKSFKLFKGDQVINQLSQMITTILRKETVLSKIKNVQMLDRLDIEGIYYLYKKQNGENQASIDGVDYSELDKLDKQEIEKEISDFLLSSTLKDCSIMISMIFNHTIDDNTNLDDYQFINSTKNPHVQSTDNNNNKLYYKIGIVDLDTKKYSSIPHYFEHDQNILKEFKSNKSQDLKTCL
ncbi:hypothetical protein CYY_008858 [Polysphondylium violaceum]|uniref:Inositol-pentakisphosphate 2-kinase n=1 Tax=Polysphondylium violaceum TaxID=133409 RepID=A0A8J4PKY4_9MYCE|nr:hypothetical protein CYY_008858 [Polysphondylium violaceum]